MINVVIWESLTDEGFQYDLINAFHSKKDAKVCCQSLYLDFIKACDNGEAFDDYSVSYNNGIIVKSDNNPEFYHKFIIEEIEYYGSNR